jgi:glucuronate isomerase
MKAFLDENFLLNNKTAQALYHDYAKQMPIIDYHCHLSPADIATDKKFENLTQIWLYGDHYKWRAMRTNGVDESFITGNKPDVEKFLKWAGTVPLTLRNPLYHWTHLELQRYFNIHEVLNETSAQKIYDTCSARLQEPGYTVRGLLKQMNVKVVCTTDDPLDNLEHHQKIKNDGFEIPILPAFRPDAAMNVDSAVNFNKYVDQLEKVSNLSISDHTQFLAALKKRHDFFAENGCKVSDHGLEEIYAEDYSDESGIFLIRSAVEKICILRRTGNSDQRCWWRLQNGIRKSHGCSNTIWVLSGITTAGCLQN